MLKIWAAALLVALLAGCGGVGAGTPIGPGPGSPPAGNIEAAIPGEPEPTAPPEVDKRLVTAVDQFGIDLLKQVYNSENLFLSPASASIILSLTANGAKGETQQAIWNALRNQGMTADEINQANRALQQVLANPDSRVQLSVANAIWHQQGLQLAPAFAAAAREGYGAEVKATDFGKPAAANAINDWVSKATRGRIPQLVDRTEAQDVMWLVNAIYFKGLWQHQFDPKLTQERSFTLVDGSSKLVPFMQKKANFGYLMAEGVRGARLPYGDGQLALYVVMPDKWDGFVEGLSAEQWQGWVGATQRQELILQMPKVKLEYTAELVEPLAAMGMERAFDGQQADFSGLFASDGQFAIGRVVQKTFLEINEEGTEAAAATGVGVVATSAPMEPPLELVLDRPFLLAIRDDRTGANLFMGVVMEP